MSTFVKFLFTSFDHSNPKPVANTLAAQLSQAMTPAWTTTTTFKAPVFTHGDINPRNIVVRDNKIVALLGWSCAGWYPQWWEYVKFFEAKTGPQNRDWYDLAGEIFPCEYPAELAAYQGLLRCSNK